ncbi:hypothetical protein PCC7418_3093 [Halothece sp. PCC 7418]|uniref:DUF2854 domain-containing protein n=1 Tax=Halothece sp. (strain PCC 7418) TaxID=65093 RepID=UPI0002A0749C|nr:DUF2854 domain-containing protein [Halothece sp. PCC 7418]AFZ45215.1 hypothetical protein PCC7418_3093 [Halothece sp. PCC 7418]
MLGQISLGKWGMIIGGALAIVGFVAYGAGNATLNLAGFFYGIPVFLGGLALKAAELKPTPYTKETPPEVVKLREEQATPTQDQIRKDVTRYRYGQQVHLEESLERLGLSPTDEERPILSGLREEAIDGAYALILEFESSLVAWETWQDKHDKIERFFGPNIRAKLSQPETDWVELALIADPQVSHEEA